MEDVINCDFDLEHCSAKFDFLFFLLLQLKEGVESGPVVEDGGRNVLVLSWDGHHKVKNSRV